jgi:hypothetical protein
LDLNQLFHRHQTSIMRASSAACPEARIAHDGLASGYAAQIASLQADFGVTSPFRGNVR